MWTYIKNFREMSLEHIFQYCLILLKLSPISVKEVIKHKIQANFAMFTPQSNACVLSSKENLILSFSSTLTNQVNSVL